MSDIPKDMNEFRKAVRTAVADYMQSEGCGCCGNQKAHIAHTERLAKLLRVKPYEDASGYDFRPHRSKP